MSLVWIIPSLGVSLLTVAVVLQLLESVDSRVARRFVASAAGVFMLVAGGVLLLTASGFSDPTKTTTAAHGVALMVAGVGVWAARHCSTNDALVKVNSGHSLNS